MFEYLMPLLVMPNYENTLLDQHLQGGGAPADRLRASARRALGISESGYNLTDVASELPVPRLRRARAWA